MLNAPTEFASRDAAMAYLKQTRGERETEASLNHRIDHAITRTDDGRYRVKHDTVRVAQGLAHMAKNLRGYAPRVECPVLIARSTVDSEFSQEQGRELAALWKRGQIVDVEGGYLLYVQNPAGTAQAINKFVESVNTAGVKIGPT
jgi:pimeloyl-ACP methyl ester carboxylesterase